MTESVYYGERWCKKCEATTVHRTYIAALPVNKKVMVMCSCCRCFRGEGRIV